MKKGQARRVWTPEQKAEIVHKHLNNHISVRTLEKEYHADRSMICKWVKKYIAEGECSFVHKGHPGNPFAECYSVDLTSSDIGKEIIINSEDVTFRIGGENAISRLNISGYRTRISGYNPITGLPNLYSLDELPVMEFPRLNSGITKFEITTNTLLTSNNEFTCSITWKPRWL